MIRNIRFFSEKRTKNTDKSSLPINVLLTEANYSSQHFPLTASKKTTCAKCGFIINEGSQIVIVDNSVMHRYCAISNMVSRLTRKNDQRPNIFSACHCGGIKIRGVCRSCGWASVCCGCAKVRQANMEWINVPHHPDKASHTFCPECMEKFYPQEYSIMAASKNM